MFSSLRKMLLQSEIDVSEKGEDVGRQVDAPSGCGRQLPGPYERRLSGPERFCGRMQHGEGRMREVKKKKDDFGFGTQEELMSVYYLAEAKLRTVV